MDKVEIFFATFQILGPLGCQGWVVMPQNVKKPNHCTLVYTHLLNPSIAMGSGQIYLAVLFSISILLSVYRRSVTDVESSMYLRI
jgi:hypothetical protein